MNLPAFIKSECCYYRKSDDYCWAYHRRCPVLDGHRCNHFELALIPIADQPSPKGREGSRYRAGLRQERQEAVSEYLSLYETTQRRQETSRGAVDPPEGPVKVPSLAQERRRRNKGTIGPELNRIQK